MKISNAISKMILVVSLFLIQIDATNLICYFSNRAPTYKNGNNMTASNINATLCTHYVYSFATIKDNKIAIENNDSDITQKGYSTFTGLKSVNNRAKFLLAVGNKLDTQVKTELSTLVNDDTKIKIFVDSTLAFLEQYQFDGLCLDWIFPSTSGEFTGYDKLVIALKTAFLPKGYLLASTVSAISETIQGYNVSVLNNYVDLVFLMTFDYVTSAYYEAMPHSALYTFSTDSVSKNFNVDYSINSWLQKGLLPKLMHLGIPLYANTWTLSEYASNPYAPPAPTDRKPGTDFYNSYFDKGSTMFTDICRLPTANWKTYKSNGFEYVAGTPPQEISSTWMGYDSPSTADSKVTYVQDKNLAGVMLWDISFDDPKNTCGNGTHPITNVVSSRLSSSFYTTTSTTSTTTPTPTTLSTIPTTISSSNTTSTMAPPNSTISTTIQPITNPTTSYPDKCRSSNAVYPEPASCRKFNVCLNGTAYVSECPLGQYFNPTTLRCENDPNNIKCPIGKQLVKAENLSYNAVKYDWKVNY